MDIEESVTKSTNFFQHITSFDTKQKNEFMNMVQYAFLLVIPVILMNKGIGELFSESTDDKTTIELSLEVVAELFVLLSGVFIIHKVITYIPTYSEEPYSEFSFIGIILVLIIVVFSFQTNISRKTHTIFDQLYESTTGKVKVETSEQSNQQQPNSQATQMQTPPDYLNKQAVQTMNPNHGQNVAQTALQTQFDMNQQPRQQLPNFDSFYEPMAANSGGGSLNIF